MMDEETARRIASNWHGGQGSALYGYASSGQFDKSAALAEIDSTLKGSFDFAAQDELAELRAFIAGRMEPEELTGEERDHRASYGARAVEVGTPDYGQNDDQTDLTDTLANLMHHADRHPELDFASALESASGHFHAETGN